MSCWPRWRIALVGSWMSSSRRARLRDYPRTTLLVNDSGRQRLLLLPLVGDDVVLDLVVRGLRDDVLADQLVLPLVRTVLHDLLGVGLADPGQRLEVGLRGAVEVELLLPLALRLLGVVSLLRVGLGRRVLLRRGLGEERRGAEREEGERQGDRSEERRVGKECRSRW